MRRHALPLLAAAAVAVLVAIVAIVALARDSGDDRRSIGVPPETFASVATGVALVQALDCAGKPLRVGGHVPSGTGFLVGSGVLMTAEHGVWTGPNRRACGFRARLDGRWYDIRRVKVWRDRGGDDSRGIDLATMTLAGEAPGHVFEIARESPAIGGEIAALGYPLGLPLSLAQGIVVEKPLDFGKPAIAAQLVSEGGMSGGPIVDKDGEVVGIVRGLVVPSQGTTRSLYGGLDLARWLGASAAPNLCRAHADDGVPGCGSASPEEATKVLIDIPRPG